MDRTIEGTDRVRPLWDEGWGQQRAARRAARLASYLTATQVKVTGGQAVASIELARAAGKGIARTNAAVILGSRFGVDCTASGLSLTVTGPTSGVAQFAAALPRVLDYAERLATQAVRVYGLWVRSSYAVDHVAELDARNLRAKVRTFRAEAFQVVVDILGADDMSGTFEPAEDARPAWDQAKEIAGGIAQYGWVNIAEAYDPADVRELLATAQTETRVVVIPCSGAKLPTAAEAGRIYTGALHAHARRTADALTATGGTVLILSALHGFLTLDQLIQPYDHTWKNQGSVTIDQLRAQAQKLGLEHATDVTLLTPSAYTQRAAAVWPDAATPLAGLGIGCQRGQLTTMRQRAELYATAA